MASASSSLYLLEKVARTVPRKPRSEPKVSCTAEASYPLCTMQLAHCGLPDSVPYLCHSVSSLVVRVSGRKHHAFDAEIHHLVEESAHAVGIGAVEERGIRGYAEAALQGFLHAVNGDVESAFAADGKVVVLALAVHVHRERQVLAGLEQVNLLFEQQSVGAQVDVLLARDQAVDDLGDLRMHQRLAAGNGHHRRTALV